MTTYKDAGVNIDAQDKAINKIKSYVKETNTKGVLSKVGNFGGLFEINKFNFKEPVLVSSSDGVGTKVKLAKISKKFHTVGQDLVNHCINDILVQGAIPLFFMDYIATSKLDPIEISEVIRGLTIACKENEMALLGGEMAEMPGVYNEGHFDLAGFIVGAVDKKNLIDGSAIKPGDLVVGLKSNGLMTNGFSLALKIFMERGLLENRIDELMNIHPCYLKYVKNHLSKIHGMAHITGGGLVDNIPRVLPKNCKVTIDKASWGVPKIFKEIQDYGKVPEDDMFRTFNMGIGFVIIAKENIPDGIVIGRVVKGDKIVELV